MATGDGEESSQHEVELDNEGLLGTEIIALPLDIGQDTSTVTGGIAALCRGQGILMEKMTYLEKIVGTVQFDMTWVRDDMKLVQQVMEKYNQHVGAASDAAADVDRLKGQLPVDGSPLRAWKGKQHVEDMPRPPSVISTLVEMACGGEELADCNVDMGNAGQFSEETLAFVKSPGTIKKTQDVPNTGRRDWGYVLTSSPDMGTPACQQARASIEKEAMQEDTQEMEMSCQSTQPQTNATGRSIWSDFAYAVRDWPPSAAGGTYTEEGWMGSQKGRWDSPDYGNDIPGAFSGPMLEEHGTVNLSTPMQKPGRTPTIRGVAEPAPFTSIGDTSKNIGTGTWRGTAPAKRPPAARPRYHNQVRVGIKQIVGGCEC